MKPAYVALAAIGLAAATAVSAQTTVYTSPAAFTAAVAAGSYTEAFSDSSIDQEFSADFSGGAFSYTVSAPGTVLYAPGTFLGTSGANFPMVVTFTGAPVTALGGEFYATNFSDALQAVPITVTLSNGFTTTFTPTNVANSFRGFTTAVPIASLTLGAPGAGLYVGMDNFTVGSVVPEPGTYAMMVLGLAAMGGFAARRRKEAQAA